jgi:hypothetical protein
VLRLVRRRGWAIAVGLALAVPSVWIEISDYSGSWWSQGAALVLGATGLALVWTALIGPRADWID